MGLGGSKEPNPEDFVYDTKKMYYDENGNLRFGGPERDVDDEVDQMMAVDKDNEDPNALWYLVETPWVNAWLAYAHYGKGVSPCPGPVDNMSLLIEDAAAEKYLPRPGLMLATVGRAGDYRRVSLEEWEVICKFHPGSGPAIMAKFSPDDPGKASGSYDTSNWTIDKKYEPKVEKKKKKKKIPKTVSTSLPDGVGGRAGSEQSVDLGQSGIRMTAMQKPPAAKQAEEQPAQPPHLSAKAAARVAAATAADSDDEDDAVEQARGPTKVDDKFVEDLLFN